MGHRNITDQPNSIFLELSMALRPYSILAHVANHKSTAACV